MPSPSLSLPFPQFVHTNPCLQLLPLCIAAASASHTQGRKTLLQAALKVWKRNKVREIPPSDKASADTPLSAQRHTLTVMLPPSLSLSLSSLLKLFLLPLPSCNPPPLLPSFLPLHFPSSPPLYNSTHPPKPPTAKLICSWPGRLEL